MPYVKQEYRASALEKPVGSGELNYRLTMTILEYLKRNGTNYSVINDIVGALECCKAEFQRRVVAPYESKKIIENGDVYPPIL